ncbi:MAG: fatty-acyl-CoA synthase [Solirubrobacteraceae bacterium]|nr:fatty-acyl-CoA synthase [Solirubrobacteraceae bacterium]
MSTRPFSRHLAELCEEIALSDGARPAIVSGALTLSYEELQARVKVVASGLEGLGVRRGSTVGLLCTNRWEWVTVALATMRLGARIAAFNTFVKAWDLGYMLEHSGAEVLVTLDRFRSSDYLQTLLELDERLLDRPAEGKRFPALRELVVIGDEGELRSTPRPFATLLEGAPDTGTHCSDAQSSAGDVAFVLYTSGSSARPKAVPLQHFAVIENGYEIGERMELTREDRVWVPVPLFWAYGASNALPATLTHGATLVLQDAFEPGGALELIERHRCTAGYLMPNIGRSLIAHPDFHPRRTASLRTGLTLGNEAEIRLIAERVPIPQICNIYGQTETYGNCCVTPASWPLERRISSQGPPLPRVQLSVRDDAESEVPAGVVGEIHVRGYVTPGYLDAPEAARASVDEDGWFATGDLGQLDEHGCLRFAGRAAEIIKTGGINVAPGEVEEFLGTHPQVSEVAVVGAQDEHVGQLVVAFIVASSELSEGELREWCAARIAAYKVPARIHFVERLTQTSTGKLDRRRLLELDEERLAH